MKKLNVFHKDITKGTKTFTVFTTKNKKNETCTVSFKGDTLDMVKEHLTDEPFSILVEPNKIGYAEKTVYNDDKTVKVNTNGEPFIRRTFYVDEIASFEKYERENISDDII